jgi:hypothetical protein
MIKLYIHVIEQLKDDNIKIDIFFPLNHTHLIMDEYGKFIYSGDVEMVKKRILFLENMPHITYKHIKKG